PLPQSDPGVPWPVLVASESRLRVSYIHLLGPPDSDDSAVVVVEFVGAIAHMFGMPNDEALAGHPLAERGLQSYGFYRVEQSSWIRRLERLNAVHPGHRGGWLDRLTHYILTFHDSMFECVARDFTFTVHPANELVTVSIDLGPHGPPLTKAEIETLTRKAGN